MSGQVGAPQATTSELEQKQRAIEREMCEAQRQIPREIERARQLDMALCDLVGALSAKLAPLVVPMPECDGASKGEPCPPRCEIADVLAAHNNSLERSIMALANLKDAIEL